MKGNYKKKYGAYNAPNSLKSNSLLAQKRREEERKKNDEKEMEKVFESFAQDLETPEIKPSKAPKDFNLKKSNLHLFKEELQKQDEKRALRQNITKGVINVRGPAAPPDLYRTSSAFDGSIEQESVTTTIFVGNLPLNITEKELVKIFIRFGPIGNIRVIRPQRPEDSRWQTLCGFVTYLCRREAEVALAFLKDNDPTNFKMHLGWGKATDIPQKPLHLSANLLPDSAPPSRLPFCATPTNPELGEESSIEKCTVYVRFPAKWNHVRLINRFCEFLINAGQLFEAVIMERERNNPEFQFLFDPFCPEHAYYRWRLFSLLQGDSPYEWRQEEFRMFSGGPLWVPPKMPSGFNDLERLHSGAGDGTAESGLLATQDEGRNKAKLLNEKQSAAFDQLLHHLTPSRSRVAQLMIWALDHVDHAKEIVDRLTACLRVRNTSLDIKMARFYVLNDILYNSSINRVGAGDFRRHIEKALPDIVDEFHELFKLCDSRVTREKLKNLVIPCFTAWQGWFVFAPSFICDLKNRFLGISETEHETDIDGAPISLADLETLKDQCITHPKLPEEEEDIDGVPLDPSDLIDLM